MLELQASVHIAAPIEEVWAFLEHPERGPECAAIVREICRIGDLPPEGADLPEIVYTTEPTTAGVRLRVHRYVGPDMEVEVRLLAEPDGDGTRYRRQISCQPTPRFRTLGFVLGRAPVRALLRSALARDLDRARTVIERDVAAV